MKVKYFILAMEENSSLASTRLWHYFWQHTIGTNQGACFNYCIHVFRVIMWSNHRWFYFADVYLFVVFSFIVCHGINKQKTDFTLPNCALKFIFLFGVVYIIHVWPRSHVNPTNIKLCKTVIFYCGVFIVFVKDEM